MWILIECEDIMDAGHDEKQRIIVNDKSLEIRRNVVGEVLFTGQGNEFHPMTPSDEGYHCPICHKDVKPR